MTIEYQHICYEMDGPVATITRSRPDQLNALTGLMQAEIRNALDQSERNPDVIGTVLTGSGRGFCAGVDMNDLRDLTMLANVRYQATMNLRLIQATLTMIVTTSLHRLTF